MRYDVRVILANGLLDGGCGILSIFKDKATRNFHSFVMESRVQSRRTQSACEDMLRVLRLKSVFCTSESIGRLHSHISSSGNVPRTLPENCTIASPPRGCIDIASLRWNHTEA